MSVQSAVQIDGDNGDESSECAAIIDLPLEGSIGFVPNSMSI